LNKIFYSSLVLSSILYAETTEAEKQEDKVKTHAELSYMKTTGNTKTETFSLKSEIEAILSEKSELKGKANALYATDSEDNEIANKKYLEAEYNYNFSKNFYGLLKTDYTDDKFSGYEYQLNVGPGVGYKFPFKTDKHSLDTALSLRYSENEFSESGKVDSFSSTELTLKYVWQIEEKLKFKQDASHLVSNDETENYFTKTISAIEYKLSENLSLGTSYTWNYQNQAPVDAERIDTLFLTSLIIDY
jgi:putative salt-induced outer membrane protein